MSTETKPKLGEMVAKQGAAKTLRYERKEICKDCNGDGYRLILSPYPDDETITDCKTCDATGKVICESIVNIFPSTITRR